MFGFIEEDSIETDVSITPVVQIEEENVVRIPETFTCGYFLPSANQYLASLTFRKSPTTSTFSRSFNKMDAYFSYVGGLVGTILGLIFIVGFYT